MIAQSTVAPAADYTDFLRHKVKLADRSGFDIEASAINPACKDHQKAIAAWMVAGGCRACFAAFGLGKTIIELETARLMLKSILTHEGRLGRALVVLPLGVRQEFRRDAIQVLGWPEPPHFVRTIAEVHEHETALDAVEHEPPQTIPQRADFLTTGRIFLTNYETVRDGKLDPAEFDVVCLDEASILRGFGGTKTFREMMRLCTGDFCDEVQTFAGDDFHEAWEAAKEDGWRCWNDDGSWTHCCPSCMEERKAGHHG